MKLKILITLLCVSLAVAKVMNLPFYHSTQEMFAKLDILKDNCDSFLFETSLSDKSMSAVKNRLMQETRNFDETLINDLKFFDIKPKADPANGQKRIKFFLLAGEHPREMIAVELLFDIIKSFCEISKSPSSIKKLLNNFEFRIVLNENPESRKEVEKGKFCERYNKHSVDLNRNWNTNWGKEHTFSKFYGNKPFSELETIFVKELVQQYNPTVFLTLHSGFYGLFMPYAFQEKLAERNGDKMKNILEKIKTKFCSICSVGSPSLFLGYKSSGTCLDYIYDVLEVPYTFAWEIYSNEVIFPELETFMDKEDLDEANTKLKVQISEMYNFLSLEDKISLVSEEQSKQIPDVQNTDFCLKLFNPTFQKSYNYILNNWKKAFYYFLFQISKEEGIQFQ